MEITTPTGEMTTPDDMLKWSEDCRPAIAPNRATRIAEQETQDTLVDSWEVKLWVRAHSPFYKAANSIYGNTIFTTAYPVFDSGEIGVSVVDIALIDFNLWLFREKRFQIPLERSDIQYTVTDCKKERGEYNYDN